MAMLTTEISMSFIRASTPTLIDYTLDRLHAMCRTGCRYKKVGVWLG